MGKTDKKEILIRIISGIAGGLVGFFGSSYLFEMGIGGIDWIYIFAAGFVGCYIQIICHELGHLLGGLYSGYKFVSFRVGSVILYRKAGEFHLGRYSLAGTVGQCLMSPPDLQDGKMPYRAYNLSGVIMNIAVVEIATILFAFFQWGIFGNALLLFVIGFGLLFVLINGIPMRMEGVGNDGFNVLHLGKSEEALRSFWVQLKLNEMITEGGRLKDMPEEWFFKPSEEGMENGLVATIEYFRCVRLLDGMQLEEARNSIAQILEVDSGMLGIYKMFLRLEQSFCEILGEQREEVLEQMEKKEVVNFMKLMKKNPTVCRISYAYAKVIKKDDKEAQNWKERFNKIAKHHPYQGEIEGEREFMELCDQYTE